MDAPLVVKLPPEGTLLRDFVLASLNFLREESHIDLEWLGDEVRINASSRRLETAFRSLYEVSAKLAENKAKRIRLAGILPNDRGILSELLNVKKDGIPSTYLDAIAAFLKKSYKNVTFSSLNKLERRANGIKLGDGSFSALNFLVTEKYEHGLEFERLNLKLKFNIELDKAWYSLVLAGFVWCISTRLDEDILFSCFPEDFILLERINARMFSAIRRAFGGLSSLGEKINGLFYEAGSIGEPFPATVLLISLRLSKAARDSGSLDILRSEDISSLPLSLCRLRRTQRVFITVDKRRVELCKALKFSSNLAMKSKSDKSVNELEGICKRTIQLASNRFKPRPNEPDFTVYNRFTTLLLQAIEQAYSVYEVVYYGSRYGLLSRALGEDIIEAISVSTLS
ncbi:MAG: hypothetical protein QXN86_02505 [Candidatus Methanomethylicaceae archaeon]